MNRKRLTASGAAIAAALIAVLIAALSAGATTNAGTISTYTVSDGTQPDHVVVTGAIHGAGTSRQSAADHGHVQLTKLSLGNGTIVADTTKLAAAIARGIDAGNPTTCTSAFTVTVTEKILRGTGAFAGVSGKLTVHGLVAAVAPKGSNGQCGAISVVAWGRGSGAVTFK